MPEREDNTDVRSFKNPPDFWEYSGAFSVDLSDQANLSIVPVGVKTEGRTVVVENGRLRLGLAGIEFHFGDQSSYWGYSRIKVIRDRNGDLLWVNHDHM